MYINVVFESDHALCIGVLCQKMISEVASQPLQFSTKEEGLEGETHSTLLTLEGGDSYV